MAPQQRWVWSIILCRLLAQGMGVGGSLWSHKTRESRLLLVTCIRFRDRGVKIWSRTQGFDLASLRGHQHVCCKQCCRIVMRGVEKGCLHWESMLLLSAITAATNCTQAIKAYFVRTWDLILPILVFWESDMKKYGPMQIHVYSRSFDFAFGLLMSRKCRVFRFSNLENILFSHWKNDICLQFVISWTDMDSEG